MEVKKEKFIVINKNDRSLRPFHIMLPKPPDLTLIDGFHKETTNQVFTYQKYPHQLKLVEDRAKQDIMALRGITYSTQRQIARIWEILSENRVKYSKEIEWIKKQIYHIRNGYWFFNEGVPTYITGFHYAYLNFWTVDDAPKVEYRERDREFFLLVEHVLTSTEDHAGNDLMFRTMYGVLYPKNRRDGATHRSLSIVYFTTIMTTGYNIGAIQSLDGPDSKKQYEKLTFAFRNMPFFIKPQWSGIKDEPESKLDFSVNSYLAYLPSLGNAIEHASTSHRSYFDGRKVKAFLVDEGGKTTGERVDARWNVQKKCIEVGDNIHGIALFPSTTAEMEAENGALFRNLANGSMYHERGENGRTQSGLITLFSASCYGREGFIDKFGKAIVNDPLEKDKWRIKQIKRDSEGKLIGARRAIMGYRKFLLEKGDESALEDYQMEIKLTPMEYLESFSGADGGVGFDIHSIKQRILQLEYEMDSGESKAVKGDLVWRMDSGHELTTKEFIELGYHLIPNSTDNARVVWKPNENGRFTFSSHPKVSNKRFKDDYNWYPDTNNDYISSSDTFTMLKKNQTSKKKAGYSLGSGAVFERTKREDRSKNVKDYTSRQFVCDYLYRPSVLEEYLEEMLMMCVYWGTLHFPESNLMNIEDYFLKRGYAGYLLYARDHKGNIKERAGFYSKEVSQDTLVKQLKTYFNLHVHKENHVSILKSALNFQGVESLTELDALISAGGCLMGDLELSKYDLFEEKKEEKKENAKKFFDTWDY